jgi:acetyl esterase/lipase
MKTTASDRNEFAFRRSLTGTAMLICPGGGSWDLYWQLEGEKAAAWLNSIGVTGIILKYRVPRRPDEPKGEPARRPLQDVQRALRLVRNKAKEWGLDPRRIGIVGFSAGGHLAMAAGSGLSQVSIERRRLDPLPAAFPPVLELAFADFAGSAHANA